MTRTIVPAAEGRAVEVGKGRRLTITSPKGRQAADFFAYNAHDLGEWLSPPHSWVTTFCLKPRPGDVLISRFRRPMVKIIEDGAEGCHDMLIAACDQFRYEFFGHEGLHASCSGNLELAMRRLGHQVAVIPQPVNFFTNTVVGPDGKLLSPPNPVKPGAFVVVEALIDLVCVVSSCPFDLKVEGWEINDTGGVSELWLDVE